MISCAHSAHSVVYIVGYSGFSRVAYMDCDWFSERLADFLLDELPESEAVLVQEHLNRCPLCMKTYRDLKGTGKFLGVAPSMRAVASTAPLNPCRSAMPLATGAAS